MPEVPDDARFSVGEWRNQMPAFQQFLTAMEPHQVNRYGDPCDTVTIRKKFDRSWPNPP
jgi:hypothetical protein